MNIGRHTFARAEPGSTSAGTRSSLIGVDSSSQPAQSTRTGLDQGLSACGSLIIATVLSSKPTNYADLRTFEFSGQTRSFLALGHQHKERLQDVSSLARRR